MRNVSHEIQSPLTSIRGFARALENEQLSPAERQHYLEVIEVESERLSRLADDLLKLPRDILRALRSVEDFSEARNEL